MSSMDEALRDLLAGVDEDHTRIAMLLASETAPPPVDPELAALATELRRLRWMEPEAPAMALLGEAAEQHADAVERHMAWMASTSGPRMVALADVVDVREPVFRLAS